MNNEYQRELKPCPFCGGEAHIRKTDLGTYRIYCSQCPTTFGRYWSWTKQEITNAWNRRANND